MLEDAQRCIASWEKYCPEYEIIEWNESNFEINACSYVKEAYEAGKWAFVSDYARFWILYNYGGLYFDTDVELIRDISDIIGRGPFMGSEPYGAANCRIAAGLGLGTAQKHPIYKEILDYYTSLPFYISKGICNDETVVTYITEIAKRHGYLGDGSVEEICGVYIYPPEYFCPMNVDTGKLSISPETRSIVIMHNSTGDLKKWLMIW